MPQLDTIPPVAYPTCYNCGRDAYLTRIAPYRLDHEKRTFDCTYCKQETTLIVKSK